VALVASGLTGTHRVPDGIHSEVAR
jgi:hypothetical protein